MTEVLKVLLHGKPIGQLSSDELVFNIDYLDDPVATRLSVSMLPRRDPYPFPLVEPWLWGLLPDNDDVVRRWARDFDVSANSVLGLLGTEIGLDCAGAVQFMPVGQAMSARESGVAWLSLDEMKQLVAELRRDRTSWRGPSSAGQFSLAGAQAKVALQYDEAEDRWGMPFGHEPSTHILKPSVQGFDDQDINEFLCLDAARRVGLRAARSRICEFGSERALVVERFDRVRTPAGWLRIHQEDFCQALGIHPDRKYQADGGPVPLDLISLTRQVVPPRLVEAEVWHLIDALIYNWLIGGTDAHVKNYGLLHSGPETRLSPLYDVSSFLPYDDSKGHKLTMAMKIGGEYRLRHIGAAEWTRFAQQARVKPDAILHRISELADALPPAFAEAADTVTVPMGAADRLVDYVAKRVASVGQQLKL